MGTTGTNLTARTVRTVGEGIHRLEKGVYLRVTKTSRSWLFKYSLKGRRREIGLGGVDQTIATVKAKAAKIRAMVAAGVDPIDEKRRIEERRVDGKRISDYLSDFLEKVLFTRQISEPQQAQWKNTVSRFDAAFGKMRPEEVSTEAIAEWLKPHWLEMPRRSQDSVYRIRAFFDFLVGKGIVSVNPARWDGGLGVHLPSMSTVRKVNPTKHHKALKPEELRAVVSDLRDKEDITSKQLLLVILTATRMSETRCMTWDEVDETERTISVPQERRKDKRPEPFVVPLSDQAWKLVSSLPQTDGNKFCFSSSTGKPVCRPSVLRRIAKYGATVHGVRSTFSDWCAQNDKNFLVSEKCLMHAVGGKVFMAYQRDDLLEKRRQLLQEWADYLYGTD